MDSTTLVNVERLFSMFPRGAPGVALLFLRAGVAASVLAMPVAYAVATPIVLGFITPVAAPVCALLAIGDLVAHGPSVFVVIRILDAVALALLGPGGYSIDAWMFGRRVIVSSDHSKE
jgi:hypothetical protein